MLEDILSAIGGGLHGASNVLSYELEDRKKEEFERRRQAWQKELMQLQEDAADNDVLSIDTIDDAGAPTTKVVTKRDARGQSFAKPTTPAPRRPPVSFETTGPDGQPVTRFEDPDSLAGRSFPKFQTPKTPGKPVTVDTVEGGRHVTKYLPEEDVTGKTFPAYDRPLAGERPQPTDDPSLPNGVSSYIGTFAGKYPGNRAAAEKELGTAMPDLQRDHPRMDIKKVYALIDAMYGARKPDAAPGIGRPANVLESITPKDAAPAGRGAAPPAKPSNVLDAVTPRTAAPAAAAPSSKPSVGSVVTLKSGQRVRVTGIGPNGEVMGEPVK